MVTTVTIGLAALAVLFLAEATRSYKKVKSLSYFFLLDGRVSLHPFTSTLVASNVSLGNFVFLCAIWGYFYGAGGPFTIAVCFVLAGLVYAFFLKFFRPYIEDRQNLGTIHEYIACRFSPEPNAGIAQRAPGKCLLSALVYAARRTLPWSFGLHTQRTL
jgi:hypothetical protein